MNKNIDRRVFIKETIAGAAGIGMGIDALTNVTQSFAADELPRRKLGKTNEMVSMFGLGGWHMGNVKEEQTALEMIQSAFDHGVNFFDSAHNYENGESERRYGKGLKGIRHKVFLMSKSTDRTSEGYEKELNETLTRLQTDYIDLYQFHGMQTEEEVNTVFGPKGAMESAEKARKEGKIRYLGMTSHYDPHVLLLSLNHWDGFAAMQMPINVLDPHYLSNIQIIVPELVKRNIGILAMKTISMGRILQKNVATVPECLRFAWSQPISVLISGCDSPQHVSENIQLAKDFKPMSQEEIDKLLARTAPFKGTDVENYKRKV